MDFILYLLALMIFWDLSTHIIEMLGLIEKFTKSRSIFSYYYPHFYWKKTSNGPVVRENWKKNYNIFWVLFWGIALFLIIFYIIKQR